MQKVVIEKGRAKYVDLAPEEEIEKEILQAEVRDLEQSILRQILLQKLIEYREMSLNPGLFDAKMLADKQAEIDKLKGDKSYRL